MAAYVSSLSNWHHTVQWNLKCRWQHLLPWFKFLLQTESAPPKIIQNKHSRNAQRPHLNRFLLLHSLSINTWLQIDACIRIFIGLVDFVQVWPYRTCKFVLKRPEFRLDQPSNVRQRDSEWNKCLKWYLWLRSGLNPDFESNESSRIVIILLVTKL